jgi:hypothetical protein
MRILKKAKKTGSAGKVRNVSFKAGLSDLKSRCEISASVGIGNDSIVDVYRPKRWHYGAEVVPNQHHGREISGPTHFGGRWKHEMPRSIDI